MKYFGKIAVFGSTIILGTIASSAMANSGRIDFDGAVTDTTCAVSVNGKTNNETIKLPDVSTSLLNQAQKTAGRTFINFSLSGCVLQNSITKASVYFVAGNTINASGRLDNTETVAKAGNVELQILNDKQQPMNLAVGVGAQGATAVVINPVAGTALLRHYVQYYATAPATAGKVKSNVEYEISYE